jgi:glycine/D-amino acid oxidase-like deaminating enzyme
MEDLTGINYYINGLWTPGTAMLQPALYIQKLADGISNNSNVTIYENSPVIDLVDKGSQSGQKIWKAKTKLGSISSPKIILAVNGIVERFGYFQNKLMTIFTYSSLTRKLTSDESNILGGSPEWGLTSADAMGSSVRRISGISGDRILIRNRWSYNPSMEASDSFMASAANSHFESFKARFPMLDKVSMEYSWGGRLCLSLNNVFAQGEVDEGIYSACCQNGLGTAKGTAIGIITAEKISGENTSLIPNFADEELPKKLMPKPLMWIGVNSYMRWKELLAGKEK